MTQPFYASSAINRHGDYRNNDKLLNSITTEKKTKVVPYYNGKNLFIEINENISVTLNEEGVYVYQCTPHLILGMIGVIQVGEAVNLNEVKANVGKLTFAVNPERLSNYLNLVE